MKTMMEQKLQTYNSDQEIGNKDDVALIDRFLGDIKDGVGKSEYILNKDRYISYARALARLTKQGYECNPVIKIRKGNDVGNVVALSVKDVDIGSKKFYMLKDYTIEEMFRELEKDREYNLERGNI